MGVVAGSRFMVGRDGRCCAGEVFRTEIGGDPRGLRGANGIVGR